MGKVVRGISVVSKKNLKMIALVGFLFLFSPQSARAEKSLQDLLDQAPSGSTLIIPSGIYRGHFTISKPLKVVGSQNVVLDGSGVGTVLKIMSKDVTIENLTIRNSGNAIGNEDSGLHVEDSPGFQLKKVKLYNVLYGVRLLASPYSTISQCSIVGREHNLGRRGDGIKIWYSPNVSVSYSSISHVRDILIWYSDHSKFFNNNVRNNRYGLHYMYSHGNIAANNIIQKNSVGIYDMYSNDLLLTGNKLIGNRGPSGYGFAVKESDGIKVLDNIISGNREGIHIDNSPLKAPSVDSEKTTIQGNTISYNDVGVLFVGRGQWNYFYRNDFNENWQHVSSIDSGKLLAKWHGNYWSHYKGFDLNQDGVGDIPYKPIGLVDSLMDSKNGFRIFRFSPAMMALQFSERSIPWLVPEPRLVDKAPKVKPYKIQASKASLVFSVSIFLISIGFLGTVWVLFKKVQL